MTDQQKQIEAEGNNYTAGLDERFRDGANDAYIAGATKYAALLAEKDKEIEELKAGIPEIVAEAISQTQTQRLNEALVKAIINKPGLVPQICANEIRKNEKLQGDLTAKETELKELREVAERMAEAIEGRPNEKDFYRHRSPGFNDFISADARWNTETKKALTAFRNLKQK